MNEIAISGPGTVKMGRKCTIGKGVRAFFSEPTEIVLGDYVSIGENTKFIVESGNISIGDWSSIHNDATVLSKNGVTIGQHCWFGQSTVIDGTGGITINNGVRVGMYSQIWTHVAAGEQIEGCTLYGETPSVIDEDVWLVGTCFVASGVTIGKRTVALAGSNITRDCPPNSVVAGAPARVKDGITFYKDVSLDNKMTMIHDWLHQFSEKLEPGHIAITSNDQSTTISTAIGDRIVFHKTSATYTASILADDPVTTHCCIENKRYKKVFTETEQKLLKFLSGNKARFYTA